MPEEENNRDNLLQEGESIKPDIEAMYPSRKERKLYKRKISPTLILDDIEKARKAMISYLESGGTDKHFISVFDRLGNYEKNRTESIIALLDNKQPEDASFIAWCSLSDTIDDTVLVPLRNVGLIVRKTDFYRQDLERRYGAPISDDDEKAEMEREIAFLSRIVENQCAEVVNNILWIEQNFAPPR
jgi:hypothetical protein